MLTTLLDRIEWNNKPPPHPKDEASQKPKRAIFPSMETIGIWNDSVLDCSLVEFYR